MSDMGLPISTGCGCHHRPDCQSNHPWLSVDQPEHDLTG